MTPDSHLSVANPTPMQSKDNLTAHDSLEIKTVINNGLPKTVFIRHRDSMITEIYSSGATVNTNLLQIEKSYTGTSSSVKFHSQGLLNASSERNDLASKILRESMSTTRGHRVGTSSAICRYAVSWEALVKANGNMYLPTLDIVVSIADSVDQVPDHPYSITASTRTVNQATAGVSFDLIDNSDKLGKRYMYFAGSIVELQPRKCADFTDGLHIRYTGKPRNSDSSPMMDYRVITVDELEGDHEFASFPTWDAVQMRIRKQSVSESSQRWELEKLEREKELTDSQHRNKKQEQDLLFAKEELKHATARSEAARLEAEAVRKDYYERRSYERKDDSEWIKFAIAAAGLVIMFWKK